MDESTWLFPDPAGPVKNVEYPDKTDSTTNFCSGLKLWVFSDSDGNVTVGVRFFFQGGKVGGGNDDDDDVVVVVVEDEELLGNCLFWDLLL